MHTAPIALRAGLLMRSLPHLTEAQTGHSKGLKTIKNLQVFSLEKIKLDVISLY